MRKFILILAVVCLCLQSCTYISADGGIVMYQKQVDVATDATVPLIN